MHYVIRCEKFQLPFKPQQLLFRQFSTVKMDKAYDFKQKGQSLKLRHVEGKVSRRHDCAGQRWLLLHFVCLTQK